MKDPITKTELLAAMRQARREWDSWIAQVPLERMSEPVAPGEWSVKDILAHTSEYDRWLGLGLALRLQKPPDLWLVDLSLDQFNAALHAQMLDRPAAEVLAGSQHVFAEMLQAATAQSEAYLFGTHHVAGVPYEVRPFELLKSESYGHYYDHLPTIQDWVVRDSLIFRLTPIPPHIQQAHLHSSNHRAELEQSALCGCFYCCSIFKPATIIDWVDEDFAGKGQTALCPGCGVDSVLGDASGYPITLEFLSEMKRYWFH